MHSKYFPEKQSLQKQEKQVKKILTAEILELLGGRFWARVASKQSEIDWKQTTSGKICSLGYKCMEASLALAPLVTKFRFLERTLDFSTLFLSLTVWHAVLDRN